MTHSRKNNNGVINNMREAAPLAAIPATERRNITSGTGHFS
ncbi:hypothetical protein ECP03048161_1418 [Escherichia coli P0304816.1]|nr:hypothetical protein ECMP02155212_1622 [Escherichia coli MP021552.12]EMW42805.1 hypothetical protein EC2788150_1304 [Escherichia coli 2788150]EMZ98345.1 hypothetical protein ECP03048161_1418 [Escherichia coli P0304816.1]ENC87682.1 hypothetical protein ECP02999179_5529 [Escherichia coli P0299917.9]ENF40697.1 hypothetical protein ECP030481615_5013 [Escherichia coli P0304816.15]ENF41119.1 hypothetical protein ECP030481614_5118 [Escherichia coli P0304816.14]